MGPSVVGFHAAVPMWKRYPIPAVLSIRFQSGFILKRTNMRFRRWTKPETVV